MESHGHGIAEVSRKTCPSAISSIINGTRTDLESKAGLRDERLEINSLSHGTARILRKVSQTA